MAHWVNGKVLSDGWLDLRDANGRTEISETRCRADLERELHVEHEPLSRARRGAGGRLASDDLVLCLDRDEVAIVP
jgi:hypothetical protein